MAYTDMAPVFLYLVGVASPIDVLDIYSDGIYSSGISSYGMYIYGMYSYGPSLPLPGGRCQPDRCFGYI